MPARRDKETGRWQFQKMVRLPDGSHTRIFGRPTKNTKDAAEKAERVKIDQVTKSWYEAQYDPGAVKRREVPTVREFWPEFMTTYVLNNNKQSEADSKESIFNNHLQEIADDRLDSFGRRKVERLKGILRGKGLSRKRINNVLTVLGKLLSYAEEIEIFEGAPGMHLLKIEPSPFRFLDFDEYESLLKAAE